MKQQGFIFLMTLIITAVISLLILTSMQHVLLYYKAINKQEALHQNFYQLEDVTSQFAQAKLVSINPSCVKHQDLANQAMEQLLHKKGCFLKNGDAQYQYLIEDLGAFPCLVVYKAGRKYASYHRRVSVVQMEEGTPVSLLQVRVIGVTAALECLGREHAVSLGVSSWRYFAGLDLSGSKD